MNRIIKQRPGATNTRSIVDQIHYLIQSLFNVQMFVGLLRLHCSISYALKVKWIELPSGFRDDHFRAKFVKFVPQLFRLQMAIDW